ncbi:MAG: T9SS type A sorting domain-containing protein [Sphingobacteriales bacterium]|nr:T9SS type A sorting domain-containing protein [Sphingobacteriales bacterium]
MKQKITLLTLLAIMALMTSAKAQNVNIPDAVFKAALVNNSAINTNGDGEIQVTEANTYNGSIHVAGLSITDLTGIEAFANLDSLNCAVNPLISLDVSNNTLLSYLNCAGGCQSYPSDPWGSQFGLLTSLDVSNNTFLSYLDCSNNDLHLGLNLTGAISLIYLDCSGHSQITQWPGDPIWFQLGALSNLDISSNTALKTLNCSLNNLTHLDVSNNTLLNYLDCSNNNLISLNVLGASLLTFIDCSNKLECLANNVLSNLDVSTNTSLITLRCQYNQLTSLDVSTNTAMVLLFCYCNQLVSLNVKNGNNLNHGLLAASCNQYLSCIEVDDVSWCNTYWHNNKDGTAFFSENCNGVSVLDNNQNTAILMYPNPTLEIIYLSKPGNITLSDLSGKLLLEQKNTKQLDMSSLPAGIYFLQYEGSSTKICKVVKE